MSGGAGGILNVACTMLSMHGVLKKAVAFVSVGQKALLCPALLHNSYLGAVYAGREPCSIMVTY